MRIVLSILLTFAVIQVNAQQTFSFSFEGTPVLEVITELEGATGLKFFYKHQWLDTLTYTGTFANEPLKDILQSIFHPLDIYSLVIDQNVYLTHGIQIIAQPLIAQTTQSPQTGGAKGLIFKDDYQRQQTTELIEIGSRSKIDASGRATLIGYVRDEKGEPVIGALVYCANPTIAVTTDVSGFYSLNLPNGRKTIHFQHAGMKDTYRHIILLSDGKLDVNMEQDVIALQELLVESERDANIKNLEMGVRKIDVEATKSVPIVLGERDVLKVATTVAGVQTVGEGAAGFNVRGGKSDQNLLLINGAPVYNASHFMGFFSVFNTDVIEDLQVYKSSIPAQYGGRLSSVFDISGKKSNQEAFKGAGGLSPVTSRLSAEIPIIKDKAGLTLGGRTTYSNWILKRIKNASFRENRASFADGFMQYDHQLDDSNDLKISTYISSDKLRLTADSLLSFSDIQYQNTITTASWKRLISPNLEMLVHSHFSRYGYELQNDQLELSAFRQDFAINDLGLKGDFNYYSGEDKHYSFGAGTKSYLINPGSIKPFGEVSEIVSLQLQKKRGRESYVYGAMEFDMKQNLKLSLGGRYSVFHSFGPQQVLRYHESGPKSLSNVRDTLQFGPGKFVQTYHGPEYRVALRYVLNAFSSVKFSLNSNRQYLHTLSNSASLSPTDIWTISGYHIKPQTAQQVSVGYYANVFNNQLEVSAESYYKNIQNLLDFKVGADFLLNDHVETVLLQGPGKSYGIEISAKKRAGRLNGWLNYTYSRSFIQLDGQHGEERINQGAYYPTNYDKPHSINLVANYKVSKRISFSYNFNYSTGRPVTFPTAAYDFRGMEVLHYSDRNTFRIPDYLRMDIGINLDEGHRIKKLTHSFWSLSVYNLLGRDNAYSVFFDLRDGEVSGYKLVIFGSAIPTLSFNFRF